MYTGATVYTCTINAKRYFTAAALMKTHTFRLGRYRIEWAHVEACCDVPGDCSQPVMCIPPERDYHSFRLALHEAMHADGIPDKYIHDKEGCCDCHRLARFLWRWIKG